MPEIRWQGYPILKSPGDIVHYIELLQSCRIDRIIEIGTLFGGSTLMFHDLASSAKIISIDIHKRSNLPIRDRIDYVISDSLALHFDYYPNTLVVLDGCHAKDHVIKELILYSKVADYIVVEDIDASNLASHGPGPKEAVNEWIKQNSYWKQESKTKFGFSSNSWLRRNL